jgi:small-conductance mechanosensitive channel
MDISDRTVSALVTGAAGLGLIVVLRWLLGYLSDRYVRRVEAARTSDEVARLRTRLAVLRRAAIAFLAVLVAWSVLEAFPATQDFARTLLASGALLALLVGVAFSTPLSNVGAGILLGLTQPVRLGDRVTVAEATGTVEEITLIHTVLASDDERRIFIPNAKMVTSVVVNRTLRDPRRVVSVRLPVAIDRPIERARAVLLAAAAEAEAARPLQAEVLVAEVAEKTVWLSLTAYAPPDAPVERLAGELRERGLTALVAAGLVPGP